MGVTEYLPAPDIFKLTPFDAVDLERVLLIPGECVSPELVSIISVTPVVTDEIIVGFVNRQIAPPPFSSPCINIFVHISYV